MCTLYKMQFKMLLCTYVLHFQIGNEEVFSYFSSEIPPNFVSKRNRSLLSDVINFSLFVLVFFLLFLNSPSLENLSLSNTYHDYLLLFGVIAAEIILRIINDCSCKYFRRFARYWNSVAPTPMLPNVQNNTATLIRK